jgi:hypothetical protein
VHTTNDLGIATPRFYEIDSTLGSALQSGNFWADDSSSDFNASIAANKLGEAFVTWTSVNAMLGINAEVRYSGRELHDTLNTIKRPGKVLFASDTFYDPTVSAVEGWGAYSSVALDPKTSNKCLKQRRAWIVNETIKDTDVWSSRIGRIGYC